MAIRSSSLAALLMALALLALSGCPGKVWGDAPDLAYTGFDGSRHMLSEHGGKPLVVNFWAVWCPPCVREMPEFQAVYEEKAGAFELVAINVDGQQSPAEFFSSRGFTYKGGIDDGGANAAYDLSQGIPVTVFIDRKGNIVDRQLGMMSKEQFEEKLAKIL